MTTYKYQLPTPTFLILSLLAGKNAVAVPNLSGAEYFIDPTVSPLCDNDPGAGQATPLSASDGAWDSVTETAQLTNIDISQLALGTHAICVRFKDATGAWGPTYGSRFTVGSIIPVPSTLAACEYYIDTDLGAGANLDQILSATDGAFDENTETVLANPSIDLPIGIHTVGVRCQDNFGRWSDIATTNFTVIDDPSCITQAETNVTDTSVKLNGSVVSSQATATASFEFGPTTAYGTNIPAGSIYSATPVAISANKTGLTGVTEYHFRCKVESSVGTVYGADEILTTAVTPNAWLNPPTQIVLRDSLATLDVIVKSDSVKVGSYVFVVTLDPTKLVLDTDYQNASGQCSEGICPGANALANRTNFINDDTGSSITLNGSGPGVGPGNDLQLLSLHFKSKLITGSTPVTLTTTRLATPTGGNIGLGTRGATVDVSPCLCGDANGDKAVNIIDALAVARKVVGLPPPPTIELQCADVDKNGIASIADAMHIARYSVGLQLPPEVCAMGLPLPLSTN